MFQRLCGNGSSQAKIYDKSAILKATEVSFGADAPRLLGGLPRVSVVVAL